MISLLLFRWGNSGLQAQRAVVTCPKSARFMGHTVPYGSDYAASVSLVPKPGLQPGLQPCCAWLWRFMLSGAMVCTCSRIHRIAQERAEGKSSLRSGTPENKTETERGETRHFPSLPPLHGDHFDDHHIGRALTVRLVQF